MAKALIAMSGGVDSSVAAYLTRQAGYDCVGGTMQLHCAAQEGVCGAADDVADARAVAESMGMPFHVFDFTGQFRRQVMDRFAAAYEKGLTPNPCIDCNRWLKFGQLLESARALDCDCIVTGHYARIEYDDVRGRWLLKKAVDESKDQSYVLYSLTQQQLACTLLPLGGMTKAQARAIAEEQGLVNARKRESQDICFVPDGDYAAFIRRYTGRSFASGEFVLEDGTVLGQHRGMIHYTIGQRKGLGIAYAHPLYVLEKNVAENRVVLGENASLMRTELRAGDVNWIAIDALRAPLKATARTRYHQKETACTVYPLEDGTVQAVFDQPIRAITPGQAVVFYQGDIVVGGGTIL